MNPEITEPEAATPAANAVSIFGQGGSPNDFPVLKAFQEYIDAEQAKARKRMLGLSVFFIVLLVVIVITFTLVVMSVINRNQSLSDRLLDIALREKSPAQPVVNVQSPAPAPVVQPVVHQPSQEESLKPVMEKFDKLAEALVKVQQQPIPVAQPAPVVVTTSPQPVVQPTSESAELARLREELRREKEERKAEQDKAKEEKRQAEIEAHRRRLYPDYYAQQDARKAAAARAEQVTRAEQAANPPVRPTETVGRAPAPLPNPVQQPVIAPERHPLPNPVQQPVLVQQPIIEPEPQVRPVAQPAPVQAQVAAKPSPQIKTEVSPPAHNTGKLQPRSYFNNSMPDEDPELRELLKKVPPVPAPVQQPKPPAKPAQQASAQPVAKPMPVRQPVAAPAAKQAPKPAVKPPSKPTPPPPATPVATPVVQVPVRQEKKTETLAIGGADGSSIPWLIEIPQN